VGALSYRAQVRANFTAGPTIIGSGAFPPTVLNWNSPVIDENWNWTPTSAFVIPNNVRVVTVSSVVYFGSVAADAGMLMVYKNGNEVTRRTVDNQFRLLNSDRTVLSVRPGDEVEIYVALQANRILDQTQSFVHIVGYGP
jgi:hypothetical protein